MYARARELAKDRRSTEALQLLEQSFADVPEPARAAAYAEIGRLRALARRPQKEIIAAYRPVADGETSAPRLLRERAAAAIAHALRYGTNGAGRNANKPVEALEAFREVAESAADEQIRAQAAVECVALTMETVKDRKLGNWSDVETEAGRARAAIPASHTRSRATVDLMECETFFYSGRHAQAADAAYALLAAYPRENRERYMARITGALASRELGRSAEARVLLEQNVAEATNLTKDDAFAAPGGKLLDVRSMSLQWLFLHAKQDGDNTAAERFAAVIRQDYPDVAERVGLNAAR